jgi:cytochrome P450
MLPWAGHCGPAGAKDSLAFGGGAHVCAGQALAMSIGDAFVTALRMLHDEIDWQSKKSETMVAGVFRQYRSGA